MNKVIYAIIWMFIHTCMVDSVIYADPQKSEIPLPKIEKRTSVRSSSLIQPSTYATLSRVKFDEVIQRGPQALISSVRVAPARRNGNFIGFKLTEIHPNSPLRHTLRTGDIVKKVNDESIERPEHFMRTWSLVARSKELWILIERDQHEMTMRWKIN